MSNLYVVYLYKKNFTPEGHQIHGDGGEFLVNAFSAQEVKKFITEYTSIKWDFKGEHCSINKVGEADPEIRDGIILYHHQHIGT